MSKYEAHAVRTLHTTRHFSSRIHSLFKAHWRATLQYIDDSGLGQNDRVLGYGCGEMPIKSVLTDRGCEVAGADFAGNPHAVFEVGPKGELDPELTAKFDAVLSTQVVEHVSDPSYYLKEAHRVLPQWLKLIVNDKSAKYIAEMVAGRYVESNGILSEFTQKDLA